jgi:hypothetical protein
MIGRFHYATGPRESGGGWWFRPNGGGAFMVEFMKDVPEPSTETLIDVEFAEDGETVLSWKA